MPQTSIRDEFRLTKKNQARGSSIRDEIHLAKKIQARDSVSNVSITDLSESIVSGDGDGFPPESIALKGTHPAKSISDILVKPVHSITTTALPDTDQTSGNKVCTWMSGCSLQERKKAFSGRARHQDLNSLQAWKVSRASPPRLDRHSVEELHGKEYAANDTHFATLARPIGVHDTGDDTPEKEPSAEMIGYATMHGPFNGPESGVYREEDGAVANDGEERSGDGVWLWDRSTVIALALFVGLRLWYEAWYGDIGLFLNGMGDPGVDL